MANKQIIKEKQLPEGTREQPQVIQKKTKSTTEKGERNQTKCPILQLFTGEQAQTLYGSIM